MNCHFAATCSRPLPPVRNWKPQQASSLPCHSRWPGGHHIPWVRPPPSSTTPLPGAASWSCGEGEMRLVMPNARVGAWVPADTEQKRPITSPPAPRLTHVALPRAPRTTMNTAAACFQKWLTRAFPLQGPSVSGRQARGCAVGLSAPRGRRGEDPGHPDRAAVPLVSATPVGHLVPESPGPRVCRDAVFPRSELGESSHPGQRERGMPMRVPSLCWKVCEPLLTPKLQPLCQWRGVPPLSSSGVLLPSRLSGPARVPGGR